MGQGRGSVGGEQEEGSEGELWFVCKAEKTTFKEKKRKRKKRKMSIFPLFLKCDFAVYFKLFFFLVICLRA